MKKKSKIQNLKLKAEKGFTLIEMILYVAIIAIFVTSLTSFAWDAIYARVKSYTHQEVNQNLRLASKRILLEIRNASGINEPVGPSSLSLAMNDINRNPTVIDVSGGRLRVGWGSSGPCPVSSPCNLTSNLVNITNLTFTDLSVLPDSINIKFSLTVQSTGDRQEYQKTETYESSAELRSN